METELIQKQFVMAVDSMLSALEQLSGKGNTELAAIAQRPVGLRDTPAFNVELDNMTRDEISEVRGKLAQAIALEKWQEGFKLALAVMSLFSGGFGGLAASLVGAGVLGASSVAATGTVSTNLLGLLGGGS